jgi:hypothetical protein
LSEHARKRARAVLRGRDDGNIILLPDRSYVGWYRHITLVMLAYAFLVGICIQDTHHPSAQEEPSPSSALIKLSTSEVRHLLARLIWPAPTSAPLICHWSWWRRAHQYWAGYYHRRRRQKAS